MNTQKKDNLTDILHTTPITTPKPVVKPTSNKPSVQQVVDVTGQLVTLDMGPSDRIAKTAVDYIEKFSRTNTPKG